MLQRNVPNIRAGIRDIIVFEEMVSSEQRLEIEKYKEIRERKKVVHCAFDIPQDAPMYNSFCYELGTFDDLVGTLFFQEVGGHSFWITYFEKSNVRKDNEYFQVALLEYTANILIIKNGVYCEPCDLSPACASLLTKSVRRMFDAGVALGKDLSKLEEQSEDIVSYTEHEKLEAILSFNERLRLL